LTLGRVHFVNDDFIPFRTMVRGCYFGEIDILLKQRRAHTVIAGECCDTLTLSKQIYENVISKEYPEIDNEIKTVASLRMQKYSDAEKELNERLAPKKSAENSYEKDIDESDSFSIEEEEMQNKAKKKSNLKTASSNRLSNFDLPAKGDVISTTFNNNSRNSNKMFSKSNLSDNEAGENSINADTKFKKLDKSKDKLSSKMNISSDPASDYFSNSEDDKIKEKVDNFKMLSKAKVDEEENIPKNNNIPVNKEKTVKTAKSVIFPDEEEKQIKDLKLEMKKYSQQQKDIMNSLNTILEKMNLGK
jgi:hypothetical protein